MIRGIDITGRIFGKLTILQRYGYDNTKKNTTWECICHCGNKVIISRSNLISGKTNSCGCLRSPDEFTYKKQQEDRFFKYVKKEENCWIWEGCIDKSGYGLFNDRGKKIKSHRYSYSKYCGELKGGYFVCHTCDNKKCVNPKHLYLGTHIDNMKDIRDRKTWGKKRKLISDKQKNFCKILSNSGISFREISEVLNISPQTVKKYANN